MNSAFSIAIPESSLAAIRQLSENSRLGFASKNPALHRGIEWSKSRTALGLQISCSKTASDHVVPANNGNFSWWGAFAKNLFSLKNFTAEFKQGGCVNVAVNATASALNPFSPSLATAGEGTAGVLAASQYNAAVQYAASAPNYLGGTGLIYPMKSSVVRGMIADANATAASAPLFALDGALLQGVIAEGISMANGECH